MGRRIIYAAPSNGMALEKFHEFSGVFEDPGFVSDEVTLNGLSQCLILSVEKLRRLIYQKSELLSGVHQIVFDDAQFIGDPSINDSFLSKHICILILKKLE
jgi:superfamily II RNA helicase